MMPLVTIDYRLNFDHALLEQVDVCDFRFQVNLQLLFETTFDLAHALAANPELISDSMERHGIFGQEPLFEYDGLLASEIAFEKHQLVMQDSLGFLVSDLIVNGQVARGHKR